MATWLVRPTQPITPIVTRKVHGITDTDVADAPRWADLIDRPVPDALGYYHAALAHRDEQPDPEALRHLRSLAAHHSIHYDLIYRTTLDDQVPLGTSKPRDRDLRFRALADTHVHRVFTDLAIPHRVLTADGHSAAVDDTVRLALAQLSGAQPDPASADLTAVDLSAADR